MAELEYAHALGACFARIVGSSPTAGTKLSPHLCGFLILCVGLEPKEGSGGRTSSRVGNYSKPRVLKERVVRATGFSPTAGTTKNSSDEEFF